MKNNLKECPFCGSNHIVFTGAFCAECLECHACSCTEEYPEDARKMWNTRAPRKDRQFLIYLSLEGVSDNELLEASKEIFNLRYEYLGNFILGSQKEKAKIALEIRKYLEENP